MNDESQQHASETIHERILVKTGALWASAIGLATLVVVALGLMRAFQLALDHGAPAVQPNEVERQLGLISRMAPLDPRQKSRRLDYEKHQTELLSSYHWLDKKQQLARIPVERAMQLIVEEYGKAE